MSYTKLFHSILDSSIWQESHQTRIVWVTMLAMADQHGEVQAAIPGLAKRAGVTIAEAEEAIATLSAPDSYSRTPDHEGRRIAKIDGGWEILNHAKYRFAASLEDRKEKAALRAKRFRDKNKPKEEQTCATERDDALRVTLDNASVTQSDDKQKQIQKQTQNTHPLTPTGGVPVEEPQKEEPKKRERKKRDPNSIPEGFNEFWEIYPRKMAKGDAIKAWQQMDAMQHFQKIIEAVKASSKMEAWVKEGGRFIPFPATWLRAQRWEDEILFFADSKGDLLRKIQANRGFPNHPDHANATAEEKALHATMSAKYKAME